MSSRSRWPEARLSSSLPEGGNRAAPARAAATVTGLIVLIAALAGACLIGAAFRRRAGRFSQTSRRSGSGRLWRDRSAGASGAGSASAAGFSAETLTAGELGAPLGAKATLVQFSTEFCTYCGPTRKLLGEVAEGQPGVEVIEIDAAERMDLTRRLRVLATPTILVLGPDGVIVSRSSGQPKKAAVLEAVGAVA